MILNKAWIFLAAIVIALITTPLYAETKRTSSGKPDLSGTYDTGTLTPLERPEFLGSVSYVYPWVAEIGNWIAKTGKEYLEQRKSDPNRAAPPKGGEGDLGGAAGGTGGYNAFYIDLGDSLTVVDGVVPTSIIYDPPNGRQPQRSANFMSQVRKFYPSAFHQNTGTATWLDTEGPGPFDGPESVGLPERCLLSFASTVPTIPSLYNNYKRIVQTDTHVMILQEMVHHARVIRIDSEHNSDDNRQWLGDSIGYWDGDVLVVETKNFKPVSSLPGATENLHVVERFSRKPNGDLDYDFTVNDPEAWAAPWSGRYQWRASDNKVYEYACHEGNYAMGNILRGARLLESEWQEETAAISPDSAGGVP